MNSIHEFFRENKKPFTTLVLCVSLILVISLPLYFFLPSEPYNHYFTNIPQSSPLYGYSDQSYEEYDVIPQQPYIICKLRYEENLTFVNSAQGGGTSYLIHTYNTFRLQSEDYYLRILYRISLTSLFKTELFIFQNDSWILNSTIFKWGNPSDYNIFSPLYHDLTGKFPGSVYDNLIINHSLVEENHEWLDLGYSEIGQLKTIQGYGVIIIDLGNTNAKNAYLGVEVFSNQTKSINYLKKFIFRIEIIWQRYKNHYFRWETLMNKVYFLGNGKLESNYGLECLYGINLKPYIFEKISVLQEENE